MTVIRTIILVLVAVAARAAQAEIYACPGRAGMTTYQNFPCQFNSLGSVSDVDAVQPTAAPAASTRASTHAGTARNVRSTVRGERVVQAATAAAGVPHPGASEDDVRKAWGEPEEIVQDEPPSGRVEIWRYKDGRSVQINRKHRVVQVQL